MSRRSRVAPSVLLGPLILSIVYSAGLAVAHLRSTEFAISQAGQLALAGASDLRPLALAKEHARAPGSLHIRVDYALDWVSGETDIGATVAITLTDNGGNVKATAAIQADSSGFFFVGCPNWLPDGCPDLELGDRVHARTDNATAEVSPIGSITAKMDETLDTVEGTLKADWFEGSLGVRCEIWENPGPQPIHTSADPDGGGFWCDFDSVWDLEVGDQVAVLYVEPDGDEVINNPPWPWMRVNYAWDAVGANYELGHTFWITVTDSSNVVKGQATAQSISRGGWQAEAGFDSVEWSPEELDIQPGDLVYIESDDGYTQTVPVGAISATLDIDADSISGQVFAQISSPTNTLEIECHPWGAWEDGIEAPVKNSWATPDGTVPFTCQWDPATEWDIQAGQDVAVMYLLPDRHRIIDVLWKSAPHLRIQKSAEGQPTSGGNFAFQIGYENLGDAAAETVVITDTLPAGLVYLSDTSGLPLSQPSSGVVVWEAGTLDAGARSEFELFVGVNAAPGEVITNIAGIATSSPSDQGEPSEKSSSWTGQIVGNDTHLSVSKSSWTPDAAPGEDLIFELQVCNHGTTGSAEVTLEDTLHPLLDLVDWWSLNPGWYEVDSGSNELIVVIPTIVAQSCNTVFLRVKLDAGTPLGTPVYNTASISCANDLETEDNSAQWQGLATEPHANLAIHQNFVSGSLVPGGWARFGIAYQNTGNTPVGTSWITDTFPVGTVFIGAWHDNPTGVSEFPPQVLTTDHAVWQLPELDAGFGGRFEILLGIDPTAKPGSLLANLAAISQLPAEDTYEDNYSVAEEVLGSPGANLRVGKTHRWQENSTLRYEIRFDNLGDETVATVAITDTLPQLTAWSGWWDMEFDWERLVDFQGGASQLTWQLQDLHPGDSGRIHVDATLDEPGTPLRWYTNTVAINLPDGDTNPEDNIGEDVAFSGGEVRRVEVWLNEIGDSHFWGEAVAGSVVTVTTPIRQETAWADPSCGGCWEVPAAGPLQPGDLVEVVAGEGLQPVEIVVPDPLEAEVDTDADEVFGQIGGWQGRPVEIQGDWVEGYQQVESDANGGFLAVYPDIPRGGRGHIRFVDQISYADVMFYKPFQPMDLVLDINYGLDAVEGLYEIGHTVWITATESDGSTVKGTAELATEFVAAWNTAGFSTREQGWSGSLPDLQPGDWIFGRVDNGFDSSARIGDIDFTVDYSSDVITGTVQANWIAESVKLRCEIWGSEGGPVIEAGPIDPDGGGFLCDFGAAGWDLLPVQLVAVKYREPDADWVAALFPDPVSFTISLQKLTNGMDAKEPPGPLLLVGDPVWWTYVITNTAGITLTAVGVTDSQGVEVICPGGVLAAGESMVCEGSGTAVAGQYANMAQATGMTPFGLEVIAEDVSHYYGAAPSVDIEKRTNGEDADQPPGPYVSVGDPVIWTYVVANTGNITLTNVVVVDSDPGASVGCPKGVLAAGETMQCEAAGTAQEGQYANEGAVSSWSPVGPQVLATDWSHYYGTVASVTIEKATNSEDADLPPGPTIAVGQPITWTYQVFNTGTVELVDFVVVDNLEGEVCTQASLPPQESFVCTLAGVAAAGPYENLGTVEAWTSTGIPLTDSDPSHYYGDNSIFEDGFETGDLSSWSRTVGDELIFRDGFLPGDLSMWTFYLR